MAILKRLLVCLFFVQFVFSQTGTAKVNKQYLFDQYEISIVKLIENISPAKTLPGTVIASPSQVDPPYFFHWVRDAALVMNVVFNLYMDADKDEEESYYYNAILDYINLVELHQNSPTLTGFGEPKFNVDGTGFDGPWGRPQNDGPALRAITLMRFLNQLLDSEVSNSQLVDRLYRVTGGKKGNFSIIKADLEYVSKEWQKTSFDLWEEVKGHHFYTRMAQWKALTEGAHLAERMNDFGAANWYRIQANQLSDQIMNHLSPQKGIILTTLNYEDGISYKESDLDVANILAINHTLGGESLFNPSDDWVLNTAHEIVQRFANIYEVNYKYDDLGTALGRYPEDQYYGGNPWFLTTFAMAELYFNLAHELTVSEELQITDQNRKFYRSILPKNIQEDILKHDFISWESPHYSFIIDQLMSEGDAFINRGLFHLDQSNGSMDEQFDRNIGYMKSARDLTWSYASYISAIMARKAASEVAAP